MGVGRPRPDWRAVASLGLGLVAALAVASTVFARRGGVDPRPLLIVMGAVLAVAPLRRVVRALPLDLARVPHLAARPAPVDERSTSPGSLTIWIGRVNGGTTSARAATIRLVPALQELARLRLADRRGIALDHAPEAAAAALGPVTWALVRPDAPRDVDASRPGVSIDTLEAAVDTLERL